MANIFSKIGNYLYNGFINGINDLKTGNYHNTPRSPYLPTLTKSTEDPITTTAKDVNSYTPATSKIYENSSNSASTYATDVMEFNHNEAELQRQFTKWQMSNQHTLEVQDLKNAGLNPILSANSGAGYGSSSAASASQSMDIAKLNAATSLEAAKIAANSAYSVAGLYTDATKYASDNSLKSSLIGNLINAGFSLLGGSILGKKSYNDNVSKITSNS